MKAVLRIVLGLSLLLAVGLASAQQGEMVAEDLVAPMGLAVDDAGNVWVVDSGTGGDEEINVIDNNTGQPSVGRFGSTSRVIRIAPDGSQTVVATLPSLVNGPDTEGGSRLAFLDGQLYATSGIWKGPFEGEPRPLMASVVRIGQDGQVTEVASTYAFELANNPDPNILDSHPYGLAAGPDGMLYVADAGANAVLRIDPTSGATSLVAAMQGVAGPLPNPNRGGALEMDPVPTAVAFDAAGNPLVSLLPGFPFVPGSSKVVSVSASGEVTDFATDLTMTTDMQRAPDGRLYAVQMAVFTDQGPTPNTGRLVRIGDDGSVTEVLSGLSFPTAVAIAANGDVYLTVNGAGGPGGGVIRYAGLGNQ
jgi:sugar lactone lactonase YvrE